MNNRIDEALAFASNAHRSQYRRTTKTPFIIHPLKVFEELRYWGVQDEDTLVASLLHDVLEDTTVTPENIFNYFGKKVCDIVMELTFYYVERPNHDHLKREYLKSFKDKSIESLVVKLADRICNVKEFSETNYEYAHKYFRKAFILFDVWKSRDHEIDLHISEAIGYALRKLDKDVDGGYFN